MALLEVEGLGVSFRSRDGVARVVSDLSYHVDRGETLAVVGESGSGKSVSSLALMGLLPRPPAVVTGHARFDGVDLLQLDERALRAIRGDRIAMVFQDPMTSLNPVRTVGHQIVEALSLHLGLRGAAARARAVELLDMVRIPDAARRIDAYPHQFSGGMRQRVMIAMGVACQPELLIADEATTALDVTTQAKIVEELAELQQELGMAMLWITHDLGVVAGIADRVVVLYGGRPMEQARVRDLFAHQRHPYTRGLLGSLPTPGTARGQRLRAITGSPPDPLDPPPGCPFAPRCPERVERCDRELPVPREVAPDHHLACHLDLPAPERRDA